MLFSKTVLTTLASTLLASTTLAADLPAIDVVGNKFFYSNNGSQFYIKGVAYQADTANVTTGSSINDPLADYESCKRDIPYLQQLDTNVIRVYAVNTSLDHSECMQAFNDAGIYIIADLSSPKQSVNRIDPTWTVDLFQRYKDVIDMFSNYTNVLGFFAGNEVTNNNTNTDASAFVKAAVRDSKQYIKDKSYRTIPVGYSSNDDEDTRVPMADYFACGDEDVKADFYGINMYEWCGKSNYKESGFEDRTNDFRNISVPIFFSEYGCNEVTPRTFTEVQALYGDNMTSVWSGGIVYMYFQETNNYGLVSIDGDSVSTRADFGYYSSEIHNISPSSANTASYTASSTSLACPATNKNWAAATVLPPTPDADLCSCMNAANTCVVSSDVSSDDYADLFDYVCAYVSCDGISGNGTSGKYGSYSFCSSEEQLNFILNLYYQSNGGSSSDCDFSGSATIQSAVTQDGCSAALKEIGTIGTNTASDSATFTSGSASGSKTSGAKSSGSVTSASGSKTSSGSKSSSSDSKSSSSKTSKHKNAAVAQNELGFIQTLLTSFGTISVVASLGFALL